MELLPKLIEVLNHEEPITRANVAETLGRLGYKEAVEPLVLVFKKDKEEYVRVATARALGYIGDERVVNALLGAILNDTDDEVREESLIAIKRMMPSEFPREKELMRDWYEEHKDKLVWDAEKKRYYLKDE